MMAPARDLRRDWPFLARAEELDMLASLVDGHDDAPAGQDGAPAAGHDGAPGSGGHPVGAVVIAAPGVGKTRLLRAALDAAAAAGRDTHLVIATRSAAHTPYAALAPLTPTSTPDLHSDLSSWYREVAAALRSDGARRPVLGVDDAHLLDPGSAALVLHLAVTRAATVIATVRRGEQIADPITSLWKDGLAQRIDLQPFSRRETEDLIAAALQGELSPHTRHRLAAMSRGNAFFVRELILGALESGSLRRVDGVWRWDGEVVLVPRLIDAIGQRIGALTAAERRTLGMIALGEPLSLAIAEDLAEPAALSRLETSGLVDIDGTETDPRCRLTHPLYGDVVLTQLGRVEQRQLIRGLADALESAPGRTDADLVRIAAWRLELGLATSGEQLAAAAVLANRAFDHRLAERLARSAIRLGGPPLASVALSAALNGQNRFDDAERTLAEAEDRILAAGDPQVDQLYLDRRHTALYMGLGRRDLTLAMLDRFTTAYADADDRHRVGALALADAYRAGIALDDGALDEVLATTTPILDRPETSWPLARLLALESAAEALAYQGRTGQARHLHTRLHTLGADGPPEVRRASATAVLQEALCLLIEGQLDAALDVATTMSEQTVTSPDPGIRALVALVLGGVQLQRGTPAGARRTLLDAEAGFQVTDIGGARAWARCLRAQAEGLLGLPSAPQTLTSAATAVLPRPIARIQTDMWLARALVQMSTGDPTRAAQTAMTGAADLEGLPMLQMRLLHLAVTLGGRPDTPLQRLRRIAEDTRAPQAMLLADHVQAIVDDDPDGLERAAERFTELGQLLRAAEAEAFAYRSHQRAGRAAAATRAAARSRVLRAGCEGADTPALRLPAAPPQLSGREAEVARLAADGLSNAEIAERLVLSVRTVESHLYQAFAKLGADRREQLAELLVSPPGPG